MKRKYMVSFYDYEGEYITANVVECSSDEIEGETIKKMHKLAAYRAEAVKANGMTATEIRRDDMGFRTMKGGF